MTITVTIETDNAAFGEYGESVSPEVSRILSGVVPRLEREHYTSGEYLLRDIFGNPVGKIVVTA